MARRERSLPVSSLVSQGGVAQTAAIMKAKKPTYVQRLKAYKAGLPRAKQLAERSGVKPPWEG